MESDHSSIMIPIECGGCSGLALAGSSSEEQTVERFNSLLCGALARPAIGIVISSMSNNAGFAVAPIQSPSIPPSIESRSFKVGDKTGQSHGSFAFSKHELNLDGVICQNLTPCSPHSDTFELQLSETCQKRFVMFDQSGSKNRIIVHPSLVNEFPTLLQFPRSTGNCGEHKQGASTRVLSSSKEILINALFPGDHPAIDIVLPPSWSSALLSINREEGLCQVFDRQGCSEIRFSDCLSRENSEDLEALLWSDEEMSSTGHFPSDLARCDTQISSARYSGCSGKKRKVVEEDDTESTATSGCRTSKRVLNRTSEIVGRASGYVKESHTVFDLSFADEASYGSSTNNQRQHEWQGCGPEWIVKKARKEKLQDTLRTLRTIIPGGESMDTALVLDEAVQFVKNLQVEVKKLEAKKSA